MYRKTRIWILVFALMLTLAACSSNAESETSTDPNITDPTHQTPQPTETQTETIKPVFEQIVLIDDENCTVKITAVNTESIWRYAVNVYLENKTDRNLMFTIENVSVNGYMCDPFWAASVSSKKKANEQICFSDDDFAKNGIEEVNEITFTLRIYDNNDFSADDIVNETFTIHP